ncbi:hypothetical protein SDC9_158050 [bioreactor metagenome]|uniref:Uncharacterized protein n=1 Tax=bioreactor metagenome TaxID=1076179 RepID=A0A645FED9_9ZZZZ
MMRDSDALSKSFCANSSKHAFIISFFLFSGRFKNVFSGMMIIPLEATCRTRPIGRFHNIHDGQSNVKTESHRLENYETRHCSVHLEGKQQKRAVSGAPVRFVTKVRCRGGAARRASPAA